MKKVLGRVINDFIFIPKPIKFIGKVFLFEEKDGWYTIPGKGTGNKWWFHRKDIKIIGEENEQLFLEGLFE